MHCKQPGINEAQSSDFWRMRSLIFFFLAEEPGKCHVITVNIVHKRQQSQKELTAHVFIPNIPEDNRLKRPRLQMRRTALFSLCTASPSAAKSAEAQKTLKQMQQARRFAEFEVEQKDQPKSRSNWEMLSLVHHMRS